MPLSSSDAEFLNKQMDRHLRRQQSWPWVRWVLLGSGLAMCAFAAWLWMVVPGPDELTTRRNLRVAHSGPATTEPVTQSQLMTVLQASDNKSERDAREAMDLAEARWVCLIFAVVNWVMGCYLLAGTLARWNRHRLDALLIGLLREKFGEEFVGRGEGVR
jgi:hypothetical protein